MIRRILYEGLLALLIAVIAAITAYVLRPQAFPLLLRPEKPPALEQGDTPGYATIELEQATEMFHNHMALFADARPRTLYLEGHIQDAVNLDPQAFDQWSGDLVEHFSPDQTFITYCDGPSCPLSFYLAERLTWLGFEHVYCLEDGWERWHQAGLPISTGEE